MTDDDLMRRFSALWEPELAKQSFPDVRPLLAHYTTIDVLESIIVNDRIWFSNPLLMNDLEEVRFGIHRGLQIATASSDLAGACQTPERAALLKQTLNHYYGEFDQKHAFDTYVLCLSKHDRNDTDGLLSMWRGYGANGDGVAIVFDTAKINPVDESPFVIAQVQYGSTRDRVTRLEKLVIAFAEMLRAASVPDEKLYIPAFAFFHRLKMLALFSKHDGFKEEAEWRIAYMPDRDSGKIAASMLGYAIGPRGIVPKLKFEVRSIPRFTGDNFSLEQIVDRIILGPTAASPLAERSIVRMLRHHGREALADRVVSSSIPFRRS